MSQPRCIEILQLHILYPLLILDLKGLECMQDFISGVHFRRDCAHLMTESGQ